MNNITTYYIDLENKIEVNRVKEFLNKFNLDYNLVDATLVIKNENQNIIATCSKLNNVIKCVAVSENYLNQNLLNKLITEISRLIYSQGEKEIFVYTKQKNKYIFEDLNFKSIVTTDNVVFLTNNYDNYLKYKNYLLKSITADKTCILVMNCNPLTHGHAFLIDYASKNFEKVLIIPVKEDVSLFTYNERQKMILTYIKSFKNVDLINGSNYLVSNVTFPSYFLNNENEVVLSQAEIDAKIFVNLFESKKRFITRLVGNEPFSRTTNLYNKVLDKILNKNEISFLEIERQKINGEVVSASQVRKNIYENKEWNYLVPNTTIKIISKINLNKRMIDKNIYKKN
ncbi:[citrate (pro-3S)-lyase] ligase [Spiroplasma corruscae]|uniref:[citrate (Pro-3S)-lyase] ligase n=1 Tax=Spiroplasma corruscae TaxID=216934 RepID=A0A222EPB3_9MOLU|nr:hypothetical protein [Spiroplasma corruscae]ASP28337.1 [citrate (pro-3S)-lyase] ligase [Spiroplasma corruscae]